MKKVIATVICLVAVASAAIPVDAQTRRRCVDNRSAQSRQYNRRSDSRYDTRYDPRYDTRYEDNVYSDNRVYQNDDYRYDDRSFWEKHRDKITTAGGAVAGAVIGGLAGGKKGALIGAIAGGGGAAVYTYKIRDKNGRY
ncbi:MAG: hypothetical protein ACRD6N_05615 [Pyrinomonadaceae bacterium]